MRVTQHQPDVLLETQAPWRGEVYSVAQLTLLPFVTRFWVAPNFHRFSVAREEGKPLLLMAEFAGGARAYVVARISGPDAALRLRRLPEWVPKETKPFKPVVTDPLGPPLDE